MKDFVEHYKLTPDDIDEATLLIYDEMLARKMDKAEALRVRLTVEKSLRWILAHHLDYTKFSVSMQKYWWRWYVTVTLPGKKLENDYALLNRHIEVHDFLTSRMGGLKTHYSFMYKMGENLLEIQLPHAPISSFGKVVIGVILAVLLGTFAKNTLPADILASINTDFIIPLFKKLMQLLSMLATFMIMFSLMSSICSMSNLQTLKKLGVSYFSGVAAKMMLTSVTCIAVIPYIFDMLSKKGSLEINILVTLYSMILNIVPSNLISPFLEGNLLQVVVISVFFAIIMLGLGRDSESLVVGVRQINKVMHTSMTYICYTIPLIVFLSFFNMIISDSLANVSGLIKITVCMVLFTALYIILSAVYIGIRTKISPMRLILDFMPAFTRGFITVSSASTISTMNNLLAKKFNVPSEIINFAVPLGLVCYKPGLLMFLIISSAGMAEMFGVTIPLGEWVLFAFVALISSFASPPVPGGSIVIIGIVFTQLHLPTEALGLAISVDYFFDMIRTAIFVHVICQETTLLAHNMKKK